MNFEIKPTLVAFHDTRPGEYATMLCNGNRLNFRGDLCFFNNEKKQFTWVFEGWINEGDKVAFVTSDREITGVVCGHQVIIDGSNGGIVEAAPPPVPECDLPSVEILLSTPNPRSPIRPVPLPKPQKPIQEPAFDSESKW